MSYLISGLILQDTARVSRRAEAERSGGGLVFFFYLEPTLVINDRARNPARPEVYIRLFIRAQAVPTCVTAAHSFAVEGKKEGTNETNHVKLCHHSVWAGGGGGWKPVPSDSMSLAGHILRL